MYSVIFNNNLMNRSNLIYFFNQFRTNIGTSKILCLYLDFDYFLLLKIYRSQCIYEIVLKIFQTEYQIKRFFMLKSFISCKSIYTNFLPQQSGLYNYLFFSKLEIRISLSDNKPFGTNLSFNISYMSKLAVGSTIFINHTNNDNLWFLYILV